jgi:hypothetical protein
LDLVIPGGPTDAEEGRGGAMRLVELGGEQRFSEGEPDLEPPEELAVGEIDDDTLLEGRLENDEVREEDVDDELLSWTLEDLVHVDDDVEGAGDPDVPGGAVELRALGTAGNVDEEDFLETLEVEDLEDLEESLDLLLALRLAVVGPAEDGAEDGGEHRAGPSAGAGDGAGLACGPEEFVCRSCFLVHHRAQLAGGDGRVCRDCAG